jgi:hypothetical protein
MQDLPVFFLFLSLVLVSGCSVKRLMPWAPSPETSTTSDVETPPPVDTPLAPQAEPSPTVSGASGALKWDFSQRSEQEREVAPPPPSASSPPPTIMSPAVTPPTSSIPPPPQAALPSEESGTSRLRNWIPGLGQSPKKREEDSNPQYVTEEDLLKVVGEFQRVAAKDTYRFPIPKDVTGANVNKATLRRLQDYEAKHPGAYPEILAFTRGRAYESMHEYEKAIAQYQIVSQSKHPLNTEAGKAVAVLTQFRDLQKRSVTATTPVEYIAVLDRQITAWQELQKQQAGTPYAALAREEEERLDQAKVTFLLLNRHRVEDGNASVAVAYDQLIKKHTESKNRYRYQIECGDFYFLLAQEYVAQNDPQSLQFDSSTFEEIGRAALRLYGQVAQEDGVIEKLEAKGKLEALEAYMAKIGKLSR